MWRRLAGCSKPQKNHVSKHVLPQKLLAYNFSIVHFLICSFKITSGNSKVICHRVKSRHCIAKNNHHLIPNIRGSDYYHLPFTIYHPKQKIMDVMEGATVQPYAHNVAAPVRALWYTRLYTSISRATKSSLCYFKKAIKTFIKQLHCKHPGEKWQSTFSKIVYSNTYLARWRTGKISGESAFE